jgi:integrase
MHNDFTLFMRTYPNGKKVVFYHAYDKDGKRVGPWTTNSLTKTAARNYCHKLLAAGILIPNKNKAVTFGEYAVRFWERGSEYIKNQESRADITDTYINNCNKMMINQILPFFGNTPLEKITDKDVNKWLLGFRERKVQKDGKTETVRYQNTYANTVFGTFNVMLAEAVRQGLLSSNPCDKVRRLKNDRKKVTILTVEEVRKLFPDNYKAVWGEKKAAYAVCRLASLTGMRIGEILGLRGEYVFDRHIYVCGQYGDEGYLPYTKTKENRKIPLIPEMIALLRSFKNGNGFVFSLDGGATAVTQAYTRKAFHQALVKIGIKEPEIKQRALTIHSWRHFLNTELLNQGLSIPQVQGVTGHKSIGMTERYNHLDVNQIADVMKAQAVIAGTKKTKKEKTLKEKVKTNRQGLTLVKMPNRKTA